MLTFNLKTKYFRQVKIGIKTHEYRPSNDYWGSRISKLKIGDKIKFKLGYTKEEVIAEVQIIDVIHINYIPICYELMGIYGDEIRYYFDVGFKVIDDGQR